MFPTPPPIKRPSWVVPSLCVCLLGTLIEPPTPIGYMVLTLGVGANMLALAANGWRMPVKDCMEVTRRHQPMRGKTRHKWLCDVIPLGKVGHTSIGDILLVVGGMITIANLHAVCPRTADVLFGVFAVIIVCSGWIEEWAAQRAVRRVQP